MKPPAPRSDKPSAAAWRARSAVARVLSIGTMAATAAVIVTTCGAFSDDADRVTEQAGLVERGKRILGDEVE